MTTSAPFAKLSRFVAEGRERAAPRDPGPATTTNRCELCSEPLPSEHRHLFDRSAYELLCACRACSLLFDRDAAGGDHYELVPERSWRIEDFAMDDVAWRGLRIPVDMAFFFHSTKRGRVVAFYPSPAGVTESELELETWEELSASNPVLREMRPDVEALLVNRARGARQHWVAPVDACYSLAGLIRTTWSGLTGGEGVWKEITRFFEELSRRAKPLTKDGLRPDKGETWQNS